MNDCTAALRELTAEVRALRAEVAALRPAGRPDPALLPFLLAAHAATGGAAWTAGDIVSDPTLRGVLADITGGRGDPGKRLGRWLALRAGAEAGGFRLDRIKREHGAWLWVVSQE